LAIGNIVDLPQHREFFLSSLSEYNVVNLDHRRFKFVILILGKFPKHELTHSF